jgi:signal transduction histidine kinase
MPDSDIAGDLSRPRRHFSTVRRSYFDRYLVAIAATLAVAVVRWWLDPILGTTAAYRVFYISITFMAWYRGLGPAFLSLILGFFLADYLFGESRGSFALYPFRDQMNGVLYLVIGSYFAILIAWLTRDVARRKQVQSALRKSQDELQMRHIELAHVSRVSVMGEMAASLAHELKQPLQAVRNYARGIILRLRKKPNDDDEVLSALEHIVNQADRMSEIISRVRDFVRKVDSHIVEIPVNDVIKDAVAVLSIEVLRTRGGIVCELASDLAAVRIDPIQIEQVIVNLARNGLEAMCEVEEQSVLIIGTRSHDQQSVEVYVRDCGKGISEDDMVKIFEPFFTTKPEGMGMGLAISRSIVEAHAGRLWASANSGRGCTFHFTLPVAQQIPVIPGTSSMQKAPATSCEVVAR